jgi:chemotaxis protein MotA
VDLASIIGVVLALVAILGGQALEGGSLHSITQPTAALIVLGGTIGATLVMFPGHAIKRAAKDAKRVFLAPHANGAGLTRRIVEFAQKARREGIVAIEDDAAKVADPFFRKTLGLAVDGTSSKQIRDVMDLELRTAEEEAEAGPKVFEAMGGYAPTVGIIGAVLGLIHVMENLSDPSKLGAGIAVAFVATVYGVASANLFFLPMAGKLKARNHHDGIMRELVVEGVCAMVDGDNPRLIEQKLQGFLSEHEREASADKGGRGAAAEQKAA